MPSSENRSEMGSGDRAVYNDDNKETVSLSLSMHVTSFSMNVVYLQQSDIDGTAVKLLLRLEERKSHVPDDFIAFRLNSTYMCCSSMLLKFISFRLRVTPVTSKISQNFEMFSSPSYCSSASC